MSSTRGGIKRSSWLIFRRRLVLIRTLLRSPLTRDDLITAVNQEMQGEGYVGDTSSGRWRSCFAPMRAVAIGALRI
jgi:hypothetical protein